MRIEFVNLRAQYLSIKEEIDAALRAVIESTAFAGGPFVASFEKKFAEAAGSRHCVGVNSGTSALHIALWALGVGRGDEVVVPTNTFFATPQSVSLASADPVFVDCEPEYYTIDPDAVERAITKKTKAVIAVNLYGQAARLDRLAEICRDRGVLLIEDCAQSHLATLGGRPAGTFGVCGCYSFYPGKNLGAFGEAGAVVTNDGELAARMATIKDHGSNRKYHHDVVGHNYRMEGIQGAVLEAKLRHLAEWTRLRRRNADLYRDHLAGIPGLVIPAVRDGAEHVYHLFVVRCPERDGLLRHLHGREVFAGIHYPVPCHLQKAYAHMGLGEGSFPVAEGYAREIISLPMYPELGESEIAFVAGAIREFYGL